MRVIIVNYNSGDYLRHCIDGLLDQTFQDFEVVRDKGILPGQVMLYREFVKMVFAMR